MMARGLKSLKSWRGFWWKRWERITAADAASLFEPAEEIGEGVRKAKPGQQVPDGEPDIFPLRHYAVISLWTEKDGGQAWLKI